MSATFKLGMDAKLYLGAAGADLEDLAEVSNVKDLTLTQETGEADITTRANKGWRATAATLLECTAEWEMLWLPGDGGFQAVRDAFLGRSPVRLAVLSGARDAAGSEGPLGDFVITNFSRNENLEEGITVSVTAKMSAYEEWVEVEAEESSSGGSA